MDMPTIEGLPSAPGATGLMPIAKRVLPVVVLLGLAVPVVAMSVYYANARQATLETLASLETVAALKAAQIESWLAERRGDASTLQGSQSFADQVARLVPAPGGSNASAVLERLAPLERAFAYNAVSIYSPDGDLLLAKNRDVAGSERFPISPEERAGTAGVRMREIRRDPAGQMHLEFVVPVTASGTGNGPPVAFAVLDIDPERFLFPAIRRWPGKSRSGETLIVRRDGDDVLFVNDLRHRPGPALSLRLPASRTDVAAVVAVRERSAGMVEGVDYRDVPVMAAYRPVAGTNWQIVAKIDRDEALAGARTLALWGGIAAFFAAVLLSAGLLLLLRQQRVADRLATKVEANRLVRHFYQMPFVGMAIASPDDRRWLQFNQHLCEILGYSADELSRMTWDEITHSDDRQKDLGELDRVTRGESEGYALEKRFLRKDGGIVHVALDVKCVRQRDGQVKYLVATLQDITGRKAIEALAQRQRRLYVGLSECNAAIGSCGSADELYHRVCDSAVEAAGLGLAWVGIADASGAVQPVASSGTGRGYLDGIRIVVDADDPGGRGPAGTAIRENRPYWCADMQTETATAPWHERARRYGWGASASLPIRLGGRAIGALTLYAHDLNGFDDDAKRLLMDLADGIGIALDKFEADAQRRAAEARLSERERMYRSLFENSLDGIVLAVPNGRALAANPAACAMLGWAEDELVAVDRDAIVDPTDPRAAAALEERTRTGRFHGELTLARKDGTRFPAVVSSALFEESRGNFRTSNIIHDQTARKEAEASLRRLSLVVEQAPDSIIITDLDANIEYVNEAFVRNSGYSREEVLGQNPRMLRAGRTPAAEYLAMWETLTQGRTWKGAFHNRRKDGTEFVESSIITPIQQPDGRYTHYVAIKEDITEKMRLAEELGRHRHHLEELVDVRTAELAVAKAQAEAANQAKSVFLANMSHEIRTPMNAILGFASLLRRTGATHDQAARLDKITAAGGHLLAIINDILDLSKIEASKLTLEVTDFPRSAILDEVFAQILQQAQDKGLAVEVDYADVPAWLRGDPTRLRQALLNYAGNAVKFTERGAISLRAWLVEEHGDEVVIRFEVRDTGIGIAPDKLSNLFQTFQQADDATTRKYGGTGLGLAITHRLALLMGGDAGVTSEPGAGSTFWFTARLARARAGPDAQSAPADDNESVLRRLHGDARLLLAEDDPINQEVALALLAEAGLHADLAKDGREALAMAAANDYDVILMDMQMPEMDGIDATRAIRRLPERSATPIIAMTANAFSGDQKLCIDAGMNDFLSKPVTPEVLYATLRQWLTRS